MEEDFQGAEKYHGPLSYSQRAAQQMVGTAKRLRGGGAKSTCRVMDAALGLVRLGIEEVVLGVVGDELGGRLEEFTEVEFGIPPDVCGDGGRGEVVEGQIFIDLIGRLDRIGELILVKIQDNRVWNPDTEMLRILILLS